SLFGSPAGPTNACHDIGGAHMAEQATSGTAISSESVGAKRRRIRLRVIFTVAFSCVLALSIYLWERGRPVRPVKLGFVTWNNDPFWDPVIRGAQDAAQEWTV